MLFDPAILQQCAPKVAAITMSAIVKTESNGFPWAIGLNKGFKLRFQPKTVQQAQAWVNYLEKNNYNFDVGLAQVNVNNIHRYGYKASDALDPCINLKMASDILSKNYTSALSKSGSSTDALQKAISAYNTGNYSAGFRNGYVNKVYANAGKPLIIAQNDSVPPISPTVNSNVHRQSRSSATSKHYDNGQIAKNPNTSKTLLYVRPKNAAAAFY